MPRPLLLTLLLAATGIGSLFAQREPEPEKKGTVSVARVFRDIEGTDLTAEETSGRYIEEDISYHNCKIGYRVTDPETGGFTVHPVFALPELKGDRYEFSVEGGRGGVLTVSTKKARTVVLTVHLRHLRLFAK